MLTPAAVQGSWQQRSPRRGMSAPAACAFPLFRERFLLQPLTAGDGAPELSAPLPAPTGPASDPALSPTKAASRMGNLRVLDLRALPRDDGPPTELRARKEKLAHYERQCSRVGDGLYVGAEWVAKSRQALADAGITHVVNCVGFLYPPYFEAELAYQTLYLQGALWGCLAAQSLQDVKPCSWMLEMAPECCVEESAGHREPTWLLPHPLQPCTCRHAGGGHPVRAV